MKFFEATGKCLKKYATFSGRASKREYWWFILFAFLFEWPYFLVSLPTSFSIPFTQIEIHLFGETDPVNAILKYVYFTISVFLLIPQCAVWCRRMHDVNKSGWSWLFIFIPIIGWFIIIRRLLRRGDSDENRYGPPDFGTFVASRKERKAARHRKEELESEQGGDDLIMDDENEMSEVITK